MSAKNFYPVRFDKRRPVFQITHIANIIEKGISLRGLHKELDQKPRLGVGQALVVGLDQPDKALAAAKINQF